MPTIKPRVLEFDVSVDRERSAHSGRGGAPIPLADAWSAEHLLLAALVRCSLTSFDHHVAKAGLSATGSGHGRGVVAKRDGDGFYAFVDVEARIEVEVDPAPPAAVAQDLVAKAERGCYIGNSLAVKPRYHWKVNGQEVA